MTTSSRNCILLFVKEPMPGKTKRRLAAELGENIAAALYRNFVLDELATLNRCMAECLICFVPVSAENSFRKWLGTAYQYLPQRGKDLGERMKNSFIEAFNMQYERAILMGSDIPDVPPAFVTQAFQALDSYDVTVGPAKDGGYYLIGFRNDSFAPEVFEKLRWGGTTVMRSTLRRLRKSKRRIHLLPEWSDVDRLADLKTLLQRHETHGGSCPRTISCLATIENLLR